MNGSVAYAGCLSPKGSRRNNYADLGVDASRRAALLVAHIPQVCVVPRALPAGRLDAQICEVIPARTLSIVAVFVLRKGIFFLGNKTWKYSPPELAIDTCGTENSVIQAGEAILRPGGPLFGPKLGGRTRHR